MTDSPGAQYTTNPTQALLRACPILQTALTCPPNQIFPHILALSKLTHQQQSPFRKYKSSRADVTEPLIERFKKVTEWNIDHLDLSKQLWKISESIKVNIEKLYQEVLLEKVNNGLQMMEIISMFRITTRLSPKEFGMKDIKKSYEALKNHSGNNSQGDIYFQRFMVLNEEERLRYKIKLMTYLPNLPENSVSKMYQLLQTSEYDWLLMELLKIDCSKTNEYKKILLSLKLEVENDAVILSRHPKLNSRFISNKTLEYSTKIHLEQEICGLSFGEMLEHNLQIYLKFDISQIAENIYEFFRSISQQQGRIFRTNSYFFDMASAGRFYQEILNNTKKILWAALQERPIYYYLHNNTFDRMTETKIFETLLVCLHVLNHTICFGQKSNIMQVIDRHLTNSETITLFNKILCFFSKSSKLQHQQRAFLFVCQIIQALVMKNEQKIAIMNNSDFLTILIENINKIINLQERMEIPVKLQQFLIYYYPFLVSFGLNTSQINLQKLYELKLKSLKDSSENEQRKLFVYMRMVINRFERERDRAIGGCKLEDFISTFPDSIGFFSEKLITSIASLSNELDQIDIFGENRPQNFKYVLNLFSNENLKKTQQIEQAMRDIIRKHSTLFMKYSQSINWQNLNKNLNISEDFVFLQVSNLLEDLKTNLVIKTIDPQELCEKFTSNNKQLINQVKMIDYVNILLKMKQNNPEMEFVPQIVQLSLLMEQIQSISLNKIVKYQAGYSPEKIVQINQLYRLYSEDVLHAKLQKTSSQLALTCWEIISQLDIQHFNSFLRHYRIYFEAMKDTTDRNLILKLLKKTYRNISDINNTKKQNFGPQLYYHNSEAINEVIDVILVSIRLVEEIPDQSIVMGRSYLNFVDQCNKQGKNACIQYNKIIVPHILSSIRSFYRLILNGHSSQMAIFGNKGYSGQKNLKRVTKAVTAEIIERISGRFSLQSLKETINLIDFVQSNLRAFVPRKDFLEQRIQVINLPQQNIELFETKVSQQKIVKNYMDILRKIKLERYNQQHFKSLQSLFTTIVTKLNSNYSITHQYRQMLITIINQIDISEENDKFNEQLLKMKCSWINEILKNTKDFKFEQAISQQFVQKFIKLTAYMQLKDPVQYEESLQRLISVLEKFIPTNFSQNQAQLVSFGLGLLQLIIKCIKPNNSTKNINYQAVKSVASTVIMTKCPQFNNDIQTLMRILKEGNVKIGSLLCELVEKETHIASMQADIKGLFLKESENLTDENQTKISVSLQTFINTFKIKYEDQVGSFSSITNKIVKKQIRKDQKKEIVFLCFDKSNSFSYSEVLKNNFFHYEPSNHIKLVIKDILSGFNPNLQAKKMTIILDSLRDLFYYSPLMIPFVMLHPIQTQSGSCDFIDLLVSIVSSKKNESINKFLLFACLDHNSLHKIKDRTIFFSEYLCFRIIKQIVQKGINRHTLFVSYQLAQLKRFAYLCKIKLNRIEGKSLVSAIVDHLQSSREGFFYTTAENNIIYLLMAIIFKQDGIDNLKKCFVPKRPKEFDREYKLINECLVPFNAYYRREKFKGKLETRQDNIIFTGNLITPFYSELYQEIYMQEDYIINIPSYITEPQQQASMDLEFDELFFRNFQQKHLKSLISLKKSNKYKDTEEELQTMSNNKHQETITQINKTYFKDQQEQKSEKSDSISFGSSDQEFLQFVNRRNRQNRRGHRGYRGRRGNNRNRPRGHRRNQRHICKYAQQDFHNPVNQGQKNTIQAQFQQSLNNIASEQVLQEKISTNFDEMKQHSEQIYTLLNEINEKLFLIGKQEIKESSFSGKCYKQCKQMLEVKLIQIDFDYNKIWMSPQEFEQYLQMSATRFSKLDESRRDEVRLAEERMLSVNLQRSVSSDSINYVIETINQNFQHLGRKLSKSSFSSNNEEDQILPQPFHFQNNMLSYRVFSDVNEKTLFEMILSFYYTCQKFQTKQFMPFLENKRIQNQLINTLLYLMRDPYNKKQFPNCYYEFIDDQSQLRWRRIEVDEVNKDIETKVFAERVLPIFQSVKNYSFYQNDAFLLQEIRTQGILGIQYEPRYPNQNNSYIPIKQILDYAFEMTPRTTFELLKGVKSLPDHQIEKIIEKLVLSQVQKPAEEKQSSFRFRTFFNRSTINTTPYENIKQLSKNPVFKQKFRATYIYGVKDPSSALLTQLIQSQIYTSNQLKEMHLKMLQKGQDDLKSLIFLNKIVQIYTDEELENATWLRQYQDTIAKAIKCVRRSVASKAEDEPILRILKLKNELGFEIKRAIFEREINEKQRLLNFDFDEVQKTNLICKKEKGIFLSTFEELHNNPDNFWLSPFNVRFINENGIRETGFGDGVRRQWFTLLSKEMVNPIYLLFSRTEANYYFFNKESYINSRHLQYYEFIGKLFGYSLTKSSILVSPSFSILLYKMILSEEITFQDILTEFPDERRHIQGLKEMIKTVKSDEDILDLNLKFTYTDKRLISSFNYNILASKKVSGQDQIFGKRVDTIYTTEKVNKDLHSEEEQKNLPQQINVVNITDILELKPGGADIKVTFDNMHQYLELTKKKIYQLIVTSNRKKFQAFMSGFKRIINPKQLSRFNSRQLRQLTEGTSVIDIFDIKKYTKNNDVDEKTAELLWKALEKLSNADRGSFLWNWIGVDKMPMEGAKIMNLNMSAARGKFIKSHTCYKNLEVPKSETEQQMQESVTIVINNLKTGKAFLEN